MTQPDPTSPVTEPIHLPHTTGTAEKRSPRRWPWIAAFGATATALLVSVVAPSGSPAVATTAGPAAAPVTSYVAAPPVTVTETVTETVTAEPEPEPESVADITAPAAADGASDTYTYEVTGDAAASITYSTTGGGQSQATEADLPWSEKVESPGYAGMTFAYVSAQNSAGGTIGCRILGPGGTVVAENTAEGRYAIVTCTA